MTKGVGRAGTFPAGHFCDTEKEVCRFSVDGFLLDSWCLGPPQSGKQGLKNYCSFGGFDFIEHRQLSLLESP